MHPVQHELPAGGRGRVAGRRGRARRAGPGSETPVRTSRRCSRRRARLGSGRISAGEPSDHFRNRPAGLHPVSRRSTRRGPASPRPPPRLTRAPAPPDPGTRPASPRPPPRLTPAPAANRCCRRRRPCARVAAGPRPAPGLGPPSARPGPRCRFPPTPRATRSGPSAGAAASGGRPPGGKTSSSPRPARRWTGGSPRAGWRPSSAAGTVPCGGCGSAKTRPTRTARPPISNCAAAGGGAWGRPWRTRPGRSGRRTPPAGPPPPGWPSRPRCWPGGSPGPPRRPNWTGSPPARGGAGGRAGCSSPGRRTRRSR